MPPQKAASACPRCKFFCRDTLLEDEQDLRACDEEEQARRELSLAHGGWVCDFAPPRVPPSVAKRVQEFVQLRPAVLHSDELIDKKDARQVELLLTELIAHNTPVQARRSPRA